MNLQRAYHFGKLSIKSNSTLHLHFIFIIIALSYINRASTTHQQAINHPASSFSTISQIESLIILDSMLTLCVSITNQSPCILLFYRDIPPVMSLQ